MVWAQDKIKQSNHGGMHALQEADLAVRLLQVCARIHVYTYACNKAERFGSQHVQVMYRT
jgi:hypothetical protein